MTRLVWYRNDLRVNFHRPLQAAMATDEPVRALYLLCPEQWRQHDVAPIRQWYVLASLLELGDSLAQLSTRQREILQAIAEGKSTKDIAELLSISPSKIMA